MNNKQYRTVTGMAGCVIGDALVGEPRLSQPPSSTESSNSLPRPLIAQDTVRRHGLIRRFGALLGVPYCARRSAVTRENTREAELLKNQMQDLDQLAKMKEDNVALKKEQDHLRCETNQSASAQ